MGDDGNLVLALHLGDALPCGPDGFFDEQLQDFIHVVLETFLDRGLNGGSNLIEELLRLQHVGNIQVHTYRSQHLSLFVPEQDGGGTEDLSVFRGGTVVDWIFAGWAPQCLETENVQRVADLPARDVTILDRDDRSLWITKIVNHNCADTPNSHRQTVGQPPQELEQPLLLS